MGKAKYFYCIDIVRNAWSSYGVTFSDKFCSFFSDKVDELMTRMTGLSPRSKISLSLFPLGSGKSMYEVGKVSKINTALIILPDFYGEISFCWKSKSGKIIKTTDVDFEEDDLECWMEGLTPGAYWGYLREKQNIHILDLKGLQYTLNFYGDGPDYTIQIRCKNIDDVKPVQNRIETMIEDHNSKSLAKDRKNGLVHNYSLDSDDECLNMRIDVGSAGIPFLKSLLKDLNRFDGIMEVTVDM